jgi:hypothetical protein
MHGLVEEVRDDVAALSGHFSQPVYVKKACVYDQEPVKVVEVVRVELSEQFTL